MVAVQGVFTPCGQVVHGLQGSLPVDDHVCPVLHDAGGEGLQTVSVVTVQACFTPCGQCLHVLQGSLPVHDHVCLGLHGTGGGLQFFLQISSVVYVPGFCGSLDFSH